MIDRQLIEFAYYIAPDGTEYRLFGGNRALLSIGDLGRASIDYMTDQGPFQHGQTVRDYRYQSRTVTLQLFDKGCRRYDWHCNIADLLDATRPNRSQSGAAGKLLIVRPDDYKEFETPARIMRGPVAGWDYRVNGRLNDINETLQFFCEDPFWNETGLQAESITLTILDSCLDLCLPACLGDSIINHTFNVIYCGTWQGDTMTITLTGPMVSPTITNETTGKVIQFNRSVANGEQITITITPTVTTVVNNSGENLKGYVTSISDLTAFQLVPKSDISPTGLNVLNVSASGGSDGVSGFQISYVIRHESAFAPCQTCP